MDVRSVGRSGLERGDDRVVQSTILCYALGPSCLCVSTVISESHCEIDADRSYIVLQLGLAGPILQVTRTVLAEVSWHSVRANLANHQVKRIATDRLREAFADIPEARQMVEPSSNSSDRDARRKGDLVGEKMMEK